MTQIEAALDRITEQHYRADVTDEQKRAIEDLGKTYLVFDKLRREGRDFDLGLCRAQSITSAGLFRWRRMGERGRSAIRPGSPFAT